MPKKYKRGAVSRRQPPRVRHSFKVGDRVLIVDISADMKQPSYDLKDDEHKEMRTPELFRFCVGREFVIQGFDRYGHLELHVGDDREVQRKFGPHHTIWVEPEFLKLAGKKKLSS
jgi:hypothetical protein